MLLTLAVMQQITALIDNPWWKPPQIYRLHEALREPEIQESLDINANDRHPVPSEKRDAALQLMRILYQDPKLDHPTLIPPTKDFKKLGAVLKRPEAVDRLFQRKFESVESVYAWLLDQPDYHHIQRRLEHLVEQATRELRWLKENRTELFTDPTRFQVANVRHNLNADSSQHYTIEISTKGTTNDPNLGNVLLARLGNPPDCYVEIG